MKSLKVALALALSSTSAVIAQPAAAQEVSARATQKAEKMCEAFKLNHGKSCTQTEQSNAAVVLDRFGRMAAVTSQEEYNTRQSELIAALASVFGMTVEQFKNPPGKAERLEKATFERHAARVCAGFEIDHARPCTQQEKAAVSTLLQEFSSADNQETYAQRQQRLAGVFSMTVEQFENPPPGKEERRTVATLRAAANRVCEKARENINTTCTDEQRSKLEALFAAQASMAPADTAEAYDKRRQDLINGIRAVFGMAPQASEAAPAAKTTLRR